MDKVKIFSREWTLVITQEPLFYIAKVRYDVTVAESTAFVYMLTEFLEDHPLHTLNGASFKMTPHIKSTT